VTMKLVMTEDQVAEDRDGWLQVRRNTIGASDIASIMGVPGAYGTPTTVYWSKVTGDSTPTNLSMELGIYLEEFVAQKLRQVRPHWEVRPGGLYVNEQRPWMSATFDRLILMDGSTAGEMVAPAQIKTASTTEGWGQELTDDIPVHYLAQGLWEMAVGGFTRVVFPVLFLQARQLRLYEIPWDEDAAEDFLVMLAEAEAFRERILLEKPPPVDWRPQTTATLKRVYAYVEDREVVVGDEFELNLRDAKEQFLAAKEGYGLMENKLRAQMGTAARAVTADGRIVATRSIAQVKEHVRKATKRDTIYLRKAQ
jgi:putative phage-type endonuclease